ncbi:hypothetical protein NET03_03720 [Thermomicrobium sp. CFH 73360]|uniref:hypothetical protein n=1 Tax=Thermomicrobium sp. CFH 73360 TaxID=2951987 RepID=UPI0020769BDE|nr:hypothetical protein [Thermomicrobium sp. CFH 73360]MCM8745633.1 hypothetical protein [Thermomicrobium sp. CFH 73360]
MTHRRCGTCRYFEEGGLAGSGWCRHPQRRDLQHMVFVRRGELACRTGWDQDLWEPRDTEERPPLSVITGSWHHHTEVPEPLFSSAEPPPSVRERPSPSEGVGDLPRITLPLTQGAQVGLRNGQSGETQPLPLVPDPAEPTESIDAIEGSSAADVPPDAQAVLAALPRICRTCRDFRPTGDGRTGWCGNSYAFPERTLVDANKLTCAGTLGSWWLPSDEWWLQQADISHHGQPTPHVDEFLRQLLTERLQERRRRASS